MASGMKTGSPFSEYTFIRYGVDVALEYGWSVSRFSAKKRFTHYGRYATRQFIKEKTVHTTVNSTRNWTTKSLRFFNLSLIFACSLQATRPSSNVEKRELNDTDTIGKHAGSKMQLECETHSLIPWMPSRHPSLILSDPPPFRCDPWPPLQGTSVSGIGHCDLHVVPLSDNSISTTDINHWVIILIIILLSKRLKIYEKLLII